MKVGAPRFSSSSELRLSAATVDAGNVDMVTKCSAMLKLVVGVVSRVVVKPLECHWELLTEKSEEPVLAFKRKLVCGNDVGVGTVTECSDLLKLAAGALDSELPRHVVVKPLGRHGEVVERQNVEAEEPIPASSSELARGNAPCDAVGLDMVKYCSVLLRLTVALDSRAELRHVVVKPSRRHWELITGETEDLEVPWEFTEILRLSDSSEPV